MPHLICRVKIFAFIGGPDAALELLANKVGEHSILRHMTQLVADMKGFKPKLEFFPDGKQTFDCQDPDIPGIEEVFKDTTEENVSDQQVVAIQWEL